MTIITAEWLRKESACPEEYISWFVNKKADGIAGDLLVEMLIQENQLDWADRLIRRIIDYKQYSVYADAVRLHAAAVKNTKSKKIVEYGLKLLKGVRDDPKE